MIFKLVSSTLLLFGVFAISLQLLLDPWMAERFERAVRENCRINNILLDYEVPVRINQIRETLGVIGILSAYGTFMNIKFLSSLQALVIGSFTFVYANPYMIIYSERFAPLLIAVFGTSVILHILSLMRRKDEQEYLRRNEILDQIDQLKSK